MCKYITQLKIKGGDPCDQECVVALSVFRSIIDEINKFTQDEKNDEHLKSSDIGIVLVNVLEVMVSSIESENQKA